MTTNAERTATRHPDKNDQLNCNRQQGFTLVEVLISLVLASFVLSLLGNTIYSFADGWDKQSELIEHQDMIRRGTSILRRDLRSLRRVSIPDNERSGLEFEANASTLSFVTIVPGYPSQEGVVAVKYSVEPQSKGRKLIRRVADYKPGSRLSSLTFRQPVEVVSGLSQLEFAFRARPSSKDQSRSQSGSQSWLRAWANTDALPGLVRLRMSNGARSTYPSAIIAVRAAAEPECVVALSPPCTVSPKDQGQ